MNNEQQKKEKDQMKNKFKTSVEKVVSGARHFTNDLLADPKVQEAKTVFKEKAKHLAHELDASLANKLEESLTETKAIVLKSLSEIAGQSSKKINEMIKKEKSKHRKTK